MITEFLVSTILAAGTLLVSVFHQLFWWQKKEYRWDRMMDHVRVILQDVSAWVFILLVVLLLVLKLWLAVVVMFFLFEVQSILRRGLLRPDWTPKMILIAAGCIFLLGGTFFGVGYAGALVLSPVIVAVVVWVVHAASQFRKRTIISQARVLREGLSQLTAVGITGSVGKTSVKHFLYQILKRSGVSVAATQEHRNDEFTIAQDMIEQLRRDVRMYIAEMGAYRMGEIAASAKLVSPSIGILTSIGSQHVALFGSKKALAAAKWELAQSIPSDGTLILNADDRGVVEKNKVGPNVQARMLWYSQKHSADVYASNVNISARCIDATIHIGAVSCAVSLPLLGAGALSSVLAACAGAHALGIAPDTIFDALSGLVSMPRTMELVKSRWGGPIIDDSYSASEHAVKNALQHLALFPQKEKLVVMVPLIELGSESRRVHEQIGKMLNQLSSHVYIYGSLHKKDILRGMGSGGAAFATFFHSASSVAERVAAFAQRGGVVLLEGRIPDIVRSRIL